MLHYAAMYGQAEIAERLLEQKACLPDEEDYVRLFGKEESKLSQASLHMRFVFCLFGKFRRGIPLSSMRQSKDTPTLSKL